ncbi:class I SAM-dependent methyltransferase [Flavobacterium polysaccharolyticum]|uniref:Class I SAM-dependent methyltransferase n=1 Tax=Flavobacterium polysaccharolyticum TaxID=3133148 RepID=A0ABU9NWV2_9FLAO
MNMYDNPDTVSHSFDENYLSPYLIQAQWAEFVALKEVIHEFSLRLQRSIRILDIGVGSGRIIQNLYDIPEIWQYVAHYTGTDNAVLCLDLASKMVNDLGINDKVTLLNLDAVALDQLTGTYDLIMTTWFTAGNFFPDDFDFKSYSRATSKLDLTVNSKFTTIFSQAYGLLAPQGEIVLGACYKDNDATRMKQELSYQKMGMAIITSSEDSFTATQERFWSQRFTKEKLYDYLPFVVPQQFAFKDLDTYEYAMQVRIKK